MQRAGIPDVYFTCAALGGRSVWFELKRPDRSAEPTDLQRYTMDQLVRAGCVCHVVRSVDEVLVILASLGVEVGSCKKA